MKAFINSILLFIGLIIVSTVNAQGFEGEIEFMKKTGSDITKYIYHVKGDMVRIDELNKENTLLGVMIVNIKNYNAISLNLDRKLYIDLERNNTKLARIENTEVVNGKTTKKIAGYNCKEVLVRNKSDKTSVKYYIAKDNFSFFEGLLIAINKKDKPATYFQQIKDIKDVFPFYAIEYDANGNEITTLEVLQVVKRKVEESLFDVPDGYSKL